MTTALQSPLLNEHDIRMFLQEPPKAGSRIKRALLFVGSGILLTVVSFFLLNASAYVQIWNTPTSNSPVITRAAAPAVTPATNSQATTPEPTATPAIPTIPQNSLAISSINVSAPIIWDVPFDEDTIQANLQKGIVHLAGTAKPGEKGTVVISGHSSYYFWSHGAYNTVFAPLHKMSTGQEIDINYNGQMYSYIVTKMYEVQPTNISVLDDAPVPTLRLITCTPVGTSLRRLVVEAVQTSPNPSNAKDYTHGNFSGTVPATK